MTEAEPEEVEQPPVIPVPELAPAPKPNVVLMTPHKPKPKPKKIVKEVPKPVVKPTHEPPAPRTSAPPRAAAASQHGGLACGERGGGLRVAQLLGRGFELGPNIIRKRRGRVASKARSVSRSRSIAAVTSCRRGSSGVPARPRSTKRRSTWRGTQAAGRCRRKWDQASASPCRSDTASIREHANCAAAKHDPAGRCILDEVRRFPSRASASGCQRSVANLPSWRLPRVSGYTGSRMCAPDLSL